MNDETTRKLEQQRTRYEVEKAVSEEKVMKEKNLSFSKVKEKLIKENYTGAENFTSVLDIPKIKIFELIERIQKMK